MEFEKKKKNSRLGKVIGFVLLYVKSHGIEKKKEKRKKGFVTRKVERDVQSISQSSSYTKLCMDCRVQF